MKVKKLDYKKLNKNFVFLCACCMFPEILLRLTREQLEQRKLDNTSRNAMVATLFCLTNFMHNKPAYHKIFFDLQGEHRSVMQRCKSPTMCLNSCTVHIAFGQF